MKHLSVPANRLAIGTFILLLPATCSTAHAAAAVSEGVGVDVVAKWDQFEHTFRSAVNYQQPYERIDLDVTFTSPAGEKQTAKGFWDGGLTWRIRFAPDMVGTWEFLSACSDEENDGLHEVSGEFTCTAASDKTRFGRHGPVRRARAGLHFEHYDGTPFLWLADTAWQGPISSTSDDWTFYAGARAHQGFTAAQWIALPGADRLGETALADAATGTINPDYFRRLDQKVEILNRAGLLSVIAPFYELQADRRHPLDTMSEGDAVRLLRYMLARWGANPVAWVLPIEAKDFSDSARQWQRIGQAAFRDQPNALVILHPGETHWAAGELRAERWVDAVGFQTGQSLSDDSMQWLIAGPFTQDWRRPAPLPALNLAPVFENGLIDRGGARADAEDVRRVLYTSLLNTPTAGVSYGAQGVWNWDVFVESGDQSADSAEMPMWKKSLFLPAARQMQHLAAIFGQFDWWRLRPAPEIVVKQPGTDAPARYIAAARSSEGDLVVLYVPEERTIEITTDALPSSPKINWHNPRTGKVHPAVAVIGGRSCQFPTPEPGDWLLVMKSQPR